MVDKFEVLLLELKVRDVYFEIVDKYEECSFFQEEVFLLVVEFVKLYVFKEVQISNGFDEFERIIVFLLNEYILELVDNENLLSLDVFLVVVLLL